MNESTFSVNAYHRLSFIVNTDTIISLNVQILYPAFIEDIL